MTREEHIAALEKYRDGIISGGISVPYDDLMIALDASITALLGPQPDPETGLVPCGCGGKAETHELYGDFSGTYMTDCKKCATGTTQYNTKKEAQDAWNTAMGWKGGAE